jgi:hypothetical protein
MLPHIGLFRPALADMVQLAGSRQQYAARHGWDCLSHGLFMIMPSMRLIKTKKIAVSLQEPTAVIANYKS